MRLGRGAFYLYRIIYMPIRVTALVYEFTMFPTKEARKMTTQVESLPKYTRKEEFWNSITHYSGFIFGIVAMIFFLTYGLVNNLGFKIIFPFMIVIGFVSNKIDTFFHIYGNTNIKRFFWTLGIFWWFIVWGARNNRGTNRH